MSVRSFPADEMEDEDIIDLMTSTNGLHLYFSTEIAVWLHDIGTEFMILLMLSLFVRDILSFEKSFAIYK